MLFNISWNIDGFLESLKIMGYGMLGVFCVMIVLYLSIVLLLKIFGRRKNTQSPSDQEQR